VFGLLVSAATGDRDERDLWESLGGLVEGRNLII